MGLDQYAESRTDKGVVTDISYWRKHNSLQGWMENLWTLKTGKPKDEFNCCDLRLEEEDLKSLRSAVEGGTLPVTEGFFYGADTSQDLSRMKDDLNFIDDALEAVEGGEKVFYSCSW
tara:strand:+ start:1654 stop:2004 length:351 start_codon:yes stop_codon:yes gene_type:complete